MSYRKVVRVENNNWWYTRAWYDPERGTLQLTAGVKSTKSQVIRDAEWQFQRKWRDLYENGDMGSLIRAVKIEMNLAHFDPLFAERSSDSLCPHGEEHHECNVCMVDSDFQYDAAREQRMFGR